MYEYVDELLKSLPRSNVGIVSLQIYILAKITRHQTGKTTTVLRAFPKAFEDLVKSQFELELKLMFGEQAKEFIVEYLYGGCIHWLKSGRFRFEGENHDFAAADRRKALEIVINDQNLYRLEELKKLFCV